MRYLFLFGAVIAGIIAYECIAQFTIHYERGLPADDRARRDRILNDLAQQGDVE